MKMFLIKIVLLSALSAPLGMFASPLDSSLKRLQWKCESSCQKIGGKPIFDQQSKTCKCKRTRHVFDGTNFNKNVKLIKRETENKEILEETSTSLPPNHQTTVETEVIVGQQFPSSTTRRTPSFASRFRERSMSQDQQKIIIQQIRDHLNRIPQLKDQRARQLEIDTIRTYLKQLSQSSIAPNPQQKSKLRNVVEEARKQRNQRLMKPHLLGLSLGKNADVAKKTKSGSVKGEKVEQKQHFDIITQDPSLVDE